MKKKFRSISWKIFHSIAEILLVLLVLILIVNITLLGQIKNDVIYSQLEESSEATRKTENYATSDFESAWIAHFQIEVEHDRAELFMDKFTSSLYKDQTPILRAISDRVISKPNEIKGYISTDGVRYYYYVDWIVREHKALVYITTAKTTSHISTELIFLFFSVLVISYFASIFAAKRIAKPIQNLEYFAEEIAQKNWNAIAPNTDNDEIGLLAIALSNMRDSLKEAEEREHHFLQATSHDLKTPVMIIKGYAQALIDGVSIDSDVPSAEIIKSESERLERKITQLLQYNTLAYTLETSEKVPLRLHKLIGTALKKFKVIRPDLEWEIHLDEVEILGDSESLLIAFENILDNQLRFAKGKIGITLSTRSGCEILISNDGPHFEIEDPNAIFDLHKMDLQGNFGLGLAIVKQVIMAHNGTIEASNLEHGVQFMIKMHQSRYD